jgi:NADH:ubiquinone oxidoreductase subunit 2 (subunit N)
MTAVESLLMAALGVMRSERNTVRFWTGASSQLVFVHILLSLGILSKGYYANFFSGDKMSLTGELVLLTGALAAYCFWRLRTAEIKPAFRWTLTILACTLVAGHLFAVGYTDTLQVQKWNGGLPPMSLLSFFLAVSSLIVFLRNKEKHISLSSGQGSVPDS